LIITSPELESVITTVDLHTIMIEVGLAMPGSIGRGPAGIVVALVNLGESVVLARFSARPLALRLV
jgi:hypothetical protein